MAQAKGKISPRRSFDGAEPVTLPRLLDSAASLFLAHGYAGTSIRELAGELGIESSSLYYHIEKKEDLLYLLCLDSLERMRTDVGDSVADISEPTARLAAWIVAHVRVLLADQARHATMLFELRSLSEPRRREVENLRRAYEDFLEGIIADAQELGSVRKDMSARHLTLFLLGLVNRPVTWFRPDGELTPIQVGERLSTLFLDGARR